MIDLKNHYGFTRTRREENRAFGVCGGRGDWARWDGGAAGVTVAGGGKGTALR